MEDRRKVRTGYAKKFIGGLMSGGNRTRAERIFDLALKTARRRIRGAASPAEILGVAVENARPVIEVRRRRVGGKEYKVPVPVTKKRSVALAIRWIVADSEMRPGRTAAARLAKAILAAYRNDLDV